MFVPFHDRNPLRYIRHAWVARGIVVANVLIFLFYQRAGAEEATLASVVSFGLIPSTLTGVHIRPDTAIGLAEPLTLVTYSFLHADFWHLAGNMLFLWVLGDNVEDATGHARFVVFYLVCVVGGGLAHVLALPGSDTVLIGASGGVAGVIAAYLILHPRVRIWVLVLFRFPVPLPTFIVLGFWVLWQIWMVVFGAEGDVSWITHLGGLVTGALAILLLKRRGVPLFARDDAVVVPPAVVD